MFPWQLLLWKWVKDVFTVIIITVGKRKRCFTGQFYTKSSRTCHPYLMDFLEEFMAFLKSYKLMMIRGIVRYNNFLDNIFLKQPLVLNIHLGIFFDSRNSNSVLSYRKIWSKFSMWYISVKKMMWHYSSANYFLIKFF